MLFFLVLLGILVCLSFYHSLSYHTIFFLRDCIDTNGGERRSRPCFALGLKIGDMSTITTICQCPAYEDLERNDESAKGLQEGGSRLGYY